MRKINGLMLGGWLLLVAGCPGVVVTPVPVMEGAWCGSIEDIDYLLTFDANGQLTEIMGTGPDGGSARFTPQGAQTTQSGSTITIVVPTSTSNITFTGTLSQDENTLAGSFSRQVELTGDLDITLPPEQLTVSRDVDGSCSTNNGGDLPTNFRAVLSGDNEVPPVESTATGEAVFEVTENGVDFTLTVNNGVGVTQAHIHIGSPTENGPVVAFLFGPVAEGTDIDGVLAMGTLTADDLVGDLDGQPIDDLIEDLRQGNIYVNVHTLANPSGEIRGPIEEVATP